MANASSSVRTEPVQAPGAGNRYSPVTQTIHWLTVILVGLAFLLGEGGPEYRVYSTERAFGLSLHETLGMAVLVLLVVRILWRLFDRTPEEPPMPKWMELSSKLTQAGLYFLLLAVPLTAIIGAWLEGHPVTLIGLGGIGPYLTGDHTVGHLLTEIHTLLGDLIIWLAGLHAAAALFHHFVMKDGVFLSMLPRRFDRD
jgi:cytochrome b561